jgi:hypothetical protein
MFLTGVAQMWSQQHLWLFCQIYIASHQVSGVPLQVQLRLRPTTAQQWRAAIKTATPQRFYFSSRTPNSYMSAIRKLFLRKLQAWVATIRTPDQASRLGVEPHFSGQ